MTDKRETPSPLLNPFDAVSRWSEFLAKSQQAFARSMKPDGMAATYPSNATINAWRRLFLSFANDPSSLAAAQSELLEKQAALWLETFGPQDEDAGKPSEPRSRDRRFRNEAWEKNAYFNRLMRSYLYSAQWLRDLVGSAEDLSSRDRRHIAFFTEQFIDAVAPTNFWATNPDVIEKTAKTGGGNLVKGFGNFLDDLTADAGHIRRADGDAFELGVNIATAQGSVVLRTDMMELIQFEPTTPDVARTPLLLVPPWVNKYYLFDLKQKSSFIRWAVDQGLTVFVISWVNPDERHADKDFEDYWSDGLLAAINGVKAATGEPHVNLFAYCLGGTLTASGLAWLAAKKDRSVNSATLVATMTDFSDFGDFEVFIDPQQIELMKRAVHEKGHVSSADLTRLFSLLRANDLIWSAAISSYLLADEPIASDLLYWFADGSGMPMKMLDTFLNEVILKNGLGRPGGLKFGGTSLDIAKVSTPMCFVSLKDDHVADWRTTYRGAERFTAPKRFILGGSGHNAGTINPPAAGKHGFWTNEAFPADSEAWLAGAKRHEGSWWTEWRSWLDQFNDGVVPARKVSDGGLPMLEPAPGSYVRVRR